MSKKRFSKSGFQKLENNFQLVEKLLESSKYQIKQLQTNLQVLRDHRKTIEEEKKEKNLQNLEFYNLRKSLCDRDIARFECQLEIAEAERVGLGLCFRRCYYLMYGKPKMSDLK
jgi:hypothetical protein